MYIKRVGCEGVNWVQLTPDRAQWLLMDVINEPPDSITGIEFLDQLSFYQLHIIVNK
jgi:hypothetical protein